MPLLHHVVTGTANPPIVFVHGFSCAHADWDNQVAHLSPRHRVVAVDAVREHGQPVDHLDLPSVEQDQPCNDPTRGNHIEHGRNVADVQDRANRIAKLPDVIADAQAGYFPGVGGKGRPVHMLGAGNEPRARPEMHEIVGSTKAVCRNV